MNINILNNFINFKGDLDKPYSREEDGFGYHKNYIYEVQNKLNGDKYIGVTTSNPEKKRMDLYTYTFNIKTLINAFRKFGRENFTFKIVDFADDNLSLRKKKSKILYSTNPKYNVTHTKGLIAINGDGEIKEYPRFIDYPYKAPLRQSDYFHHLDDTDINQIKPFEGSVLISIDAFNSLSEKEKITYIKKSQQILKDESLVFIFRGETKTYSSVRELKSASALTKQSIQETLGGKQTGYFIFKKVDFDKLSKKEKEEIIKKSYEDITTEKTKEKDYQIEHYISIDENGNIRKVSDFPDELENVIVNSSKIYASSRNIPHAVLNRIWIKDERFLNMSDKDKKAFLINAIKTLRKHYVYVVYRNNHYRRFNSNEEAASHLKMSKEEVIDCKSNLRFINTRNCYIATWNNLKMFYPEIYKKEAEEIKFKLLKNE